MQQVRIEPQIAKRRTFEGISARTNPKVSMLKEILPTPLTVFAGKLHLDVVGRLADGLVRHPEHHHIRLLTSDSVENRLVNRREKVIVSINELQILPARVLDSCVSRHTEPRLFLSEIADAFPADKGGRHFTTVVHNDNLGLFGRETKCLNPLQTGLQKGFRLVVIGDDERDEWLHN